MTLDRLASRVLRTLPPEQAHRATLTALKMGVFLPQRDPARWGNAVTLRRSGLRLANPIGLAAGFDKNAEVIAAMARFGFGFVECGTVTPRPQAGNRAPRVYRLNQDRAIINRLGFNNDGLDLFCENLAAFAGKRPCPVGANVGANKDSSDFIADYEGGIARVHDLADYITINISSPNTPGLRDLQGKSALEALLNRCEDAWQAAGGTTPVFLKLAPDLTSEDRGEIIETLGLRGRWLSGLIISNTTLSRPASLKSALSGEAGGLSGRPLMSLSTGVLADFATELGDSFDLIGCGGISHGRDVYEKIRAGAQAVQLYTALVYEGASLVARLDRQLRSCLEADGFSSVKEAVGTGLARST